MGNQRTIGLALGGGGARGLAHIGVLQVLEENGLAVTAISGSSVGAIIGAGYALYQSYHRVRERFFEFLDSPLYHEINFERIKAAVTEPEDDSLPHRLGWLIKRNYLRGRLLTKSGLLSAETFGRVIDFLIPDRAFADTQLKYCCTALDLTNGRPHVFRRGPLRPAILASSSAGGLVAPVHVEGRTMTDGCWVWTVPVEPLRGTYVEAIIAIDVDQDLRPVEEFGSIVDIILRAHDAALDVVKQDQLTMAELVIRPQVGNFHWSDFKEADRIIALGRQAAQEALPQIKDLAVRRWWTGAALQSGFFKRVRRAPK